MTKRIESRGPEKGCSQGVARHVGGAELHRYLRKREGAPEPRGLEQLSAERFTAIERHLGTCSKCRRVLASYESLAVLRKQEEKGRKQELAGTAAISDSRLREIEEAHRESLDRAAALLNSLAETSPLSQEPSALAEIGLGEYKRLNSMLQRGDFASLFKEMRDALSSAETSAASRWTRMNIILDRLINEAERDPERRKELESATEKSLMIEHAPVNLQQMAPTEASLVVVLAGSMLLRWAKRPNVNLTEIQGLESMFSEETGTLDMRFWLVAARQHRPMLRARLWGE